MKGRILMGKLMKKRMLDLKELAAYIGLAEQTIKNMRSKGEFPIPSKHICRKLLWDKRDVDAYIDRLTRRD
jgi:predicted DNA-binding transcriptional regulator AlpA